MNTSKAGPQKQTATRIIILALLLCQALSLPSVAQEAIPIQEAEAKGWVSIRVEGGGASFYPTIDMYVTNLSRDKLKILVPTGLILHNQDGGLSDLIIAGDTIKTLQKAETDRLLQVHIYSTDISQKFSAPGATYTIGDVTTDTDTLALLQQAATYNDPLVGQIALWMHINHLDLDAIQEQIQQKITPDQQAQAAEIFPTAGIPMPEPTTPEPPVITPEPPSGETPETTPETPEVTPEPTNDGNGDPPDLPIGLIVGGSIGLLLVAGIGIIINRKGLPFELPDLFSRRR